MASIQEKLDVVKTVMQENIQQILLNEQKLENIEASAVKLNQQSEAFSTNTKALSNKMYAYLFSSFSVHALSVLPHLLLLSIEALLSVDIE